MSTTSSAFGPSSCALGPHATGTQDARHLCKASFTSATIYYPLSDGLPLLPSVVIVGGQGCGEQVMAAWGPFYASHGIVAMTIGTPSPWIDSPAARSQALLDASSALQSEHVREGSVLQGRLDVERRAVQGYSVGGGGAQLAGLNDQTLRCVIALTPNDGTDDYPCKGMCYPDQTLSFSSERTTSVPVLIICGEKDTDGGAPKKQGWPQYRQTGATKLIMEVTGGDHFVGNGPAGGTEHELYAVGTKECSDCNGMCVVFNAFCCFCCPPALRCTPCPFPDGNFNGPGGHAKDHAPRGAIGGVALAWLRLFLQGDETARSQLAMRPDIACGFESSGVVAPLAMDR